MSITATPALQEQWLAFKAANPKTRIRDAALQMKVSEGELVAAFTRRCVTRLNNEFQTLMACMPGLGKVMVLTRNEHCVIERKGKFEEVNVGNPHVGTVLGKDIDLRMFFSRWKHGFIVSDDAEASFKQSIQIFDAQGTAIIKIYPTAETDNEAWAVLEKQFAAEEQSTALITVEASPKKAHATSIDNIAFLEGWAGLQDTHDFFPLLAKYNLARTHALEIAEGRFTRVISNNCVKQMLESAAASGLEIMVFVGNPGNIEIHTGPVVKIVEIPSWINVMDPDFNLHLKTDSIAKCWAVEKPSVDGIVTSVEVFDAEGEMIAQFFGKRKPGSPELEAWRELVKGL
jgi:putative hemin transport protein